MKLGNPLKSAVPALFLAACASTDPGLQLQWAGIYATTSFEQRADPNTPTGFRQVNVDGVQLIARTSQIPARLGTQFGISYDFVGLQGRKVPHRVVWLFPAAGMKNPRTMQSATRYENRVTCYSGESCMAAWHFNEPWEMVPGAWVVEIWMGEKRLIAQTFEIIAQ
jgi:hypothetical protein